MLPKAGFEIKRVKNDVCMHFKKSFDQKLRGTNFLNAFFVITFFLHFV